ncbi:MAG: OmpA family protein [Alphaproteobacteria bacterium]
MSAQSFIVNVLSVVLIIILVGFSGLIIDRMVLQGRYTSPYNKDEAIKSLAERLNTQVQDNNNLKAQLQDIQAQLDATSQQLASLPIVQLNTGLFQTLGGEKGIRMEKGRMIFNEQTFFKEDSLTLSKTAQKSLDKIALHLLRLEKRSRTPWVVRVEGHADRQSTPSVNGYDSKWMMGYKRAYAVAQYLINKGVDAKRFYLVSFSTYRPGPYPHNRRVSLSFDYA